jgi:hypothetical protein
MRRYLRIYSLLGIVALASCGDAEEIDDSFDAGFGTDAGLQDPGDAAIDAGIEASDAGSPADSGRPFAQVFDIDLGAVSPTQTSRFYIPRKTVGFNLVLQPPASFDGGFVQTVVVRSLTSPSGEIVVSNGSPVPASAGGSNGLFGYTAASVPQNELASAMPVEPGTWGAKFKCSENSRVTGKAQMTEDGEFHGGLLDVHLYLAGGLQIGDPARTVDAALAPSDADVISRLDAFFDAVKKLFGVDRGEVVFHDIPESYRTISSTEEYNALMAESRAAGDVQAAHFFWVNVLETVPGYPSWGQASGIPGAAFISGTPLSGVALAIDPRFPANGDGLTMAHELGHFVGIFHTSELIPGYFDPLSDTPECPGISAEDYGACPDKNNLMFPLYFGATGGVGIVVSPSQVRVFQRSPMVRAFASGEFAQPPRRFVAGFDPAALFGRPGGTLTEVETLLLATLSADARRDALSSLRGHPEAPAALTFAAQDACAPALLRQAARGALQQLAAEPPASVERGARE